MRNMSFMLTPAQIMAQNKTVTRRQGWRHLKVGDLIQPVKKGMGLSKGEKVEKLGGPIRITDIRREPISSITLDDCVREGFPWMNPADFILMYCKANKCTASALCTRISFEYVNPIWTDFYGVTIKSNDDDNFLIWSWEHNAWWAESGRGYIARENHSQAGIFSLHNAYEIVLNANRAMKAGTCNEEMVPASKVDLFLSELEMRG